VIEDTHENLKPTTFFQRMRRVKVPVDRAGARLAIDAFPRIDDVILSAQAIAIRVQ
jgi:hypothetical protein